MGLRARTLKSVILLSLASLCGAHMALSAPSSIATRSLNLKDTRIEFTLPPEWQEVKKAFGVPLSLIGPLENGARPVVGILAFGKAGFPVEAQNLSENQKTYRNGRELLMTKLGARTLSFEPYQEEHWSPEVIAHRQGHRYELNGVEFIEISYYLSCNGKLVQAKSLLRQGMSPQAFRNAELALRSVRCR